MHKITKALWVTTTLLLLVLGLPSALEAKASKTTNYGCKSSPHTAEPRPLEDPEIQPPIKLRAVKSKYTKKLKKERVQGMVIVEGVIGCDGRVYSLKPFSSPDSRLTARVLKAVSQWRFQPATLKGKPVPVYYNLTVNMLLE